MHMGLVSGLTGARQADGGGVLALIYISFVFLLDRPVMAGILLFLRETFRLIVSIGGIYGGN
jgi:hypothetical protein